MEYDWLIENVNIATFAADTDGYGIQEKAAVAIQGNEIVFVGPMDAWSKDHSNIEVRRKIDGAGKWVTPGLIDCHTHLVFGGNRAEEFEWRLQGESYESIAKKGGGILSSVRHTRALSLEDLYRQSAPRLERLLEEGVTTVEIKSGYGLDTETEIKMLRVAKMLEEHYPVTIKTTFLGAHAVPPEFQHFDHPKQAYINHICSEMLPAIAAQKLADAVDVFCEGIGFSADQCEQVYQAAQQYNLPIKAHAEQLSDLKGAVRAAQYQAISVDHIEYLNAEDVSQLRSTVAVLLPAAFYCLKETQLPPIEALRKNNTPMAVATDLNPGTAPVASLLTAMNQACILMGLTPQEALKGATHFAAQALDIKTKGQIKTGFDADILLWNIQHPAELAYGVNFHRPACIWQAGKLKGGKEASRYGF